jgi:hypothetical protein
VDGKPVSLGHADGLLLHGAGVSVDVDGGGQGHMPRQDARVVESEVSDVVASRKSLCRSLGAVALAAGTPVSHLLALL